MSEALGRGLSVLERLAGRPEGMQLGVLATELGIPRSACHRVLAELQRRGYVRQMREQGDYVMTIKPAQLGWRFLSNAGFLDVVEPLAERLASSCEELVQVATVAGSRITWVATAQGRKRGLRYDPGLDADVRLSCTAAGHAWLSTMPEERALKLVSGQGFGLAQDYGPAAPSTVKALLAALRKARSAGYATVDEDFAHGIAALAAPVSRNGVAIGVIGIAGPGFA